MAFRVSGIASFGARFYNELITGTPAGFGWSGCRKMIVYARMYAHT